MPVEPTPNQDADELERCCERSAYAMQLIAYWIEQLANPDRLDLNGQDDRSQCCTDIVNAIGIVAGNLGAIAAALGGLSGVAPVPVDLGPILAQLAALVAAVANIKTTPATDLGPVVAALDSIETTLAKFAPADLTHLNLQADSQTDARAQTEATILAIDTDIRTKATLYGGNF